MGRGREEYLGHWELFIKKKSIYYKLSSCPWITPLKRKTMIFDFFSFDPIEYII